MKKRNILILCLLFITMALFSAPKYLFKIATDAPADSSWHNTLKAINRELYYATNKEVGIKVYTGGVMGDEATVIKKIKIGQLSGSALSNSGMQMIYNDFGVLGLPLMIQNEQEFDHLIQEMGPVLERNIEKTGFVVLAWSEVGPINVYSKKEVYSLDTLKSSKPFVREGDRTSLALFEEVKVSPIRLQTADILTSLQTGQIDTVFAPPYGLIAMQWHPKVQYMADFSLGFMIGTMVVDKDLFYSMPADYQKKMRDIFKKHFASLTVEIRKNNQMAYKAIKEYGIKVLHVPSKDVALFYEVGERVAQRMLREQGYTLDLYNEVRRKVLEVRQ